MITIPEAKKLAKQMLSPRRYQHTRNVSRAARTLALRFGADADKAELAGWLHDIVKESPREELLQMMGQDAIMAGLTKGRPEPVWHGPCAAIYARHSLGVDDADILSAIACHTTGKAGMSLLDKVLYLADTISEERTMPGVQAIRKLAETDLDAAVVAAMEENLDYLVHSGRPIDPESRQALQAMKAARH